MAHHGNSNAGEPDALSVNGFCTRYGISRSLFYAQVRAGRLRVTKIGRKSIVMTRDAQAWLASLPASNMTEAA